MKPTHSQARVHATCMHNFADVQMATASKVSTAYKVATAYKSDAMQGGYLVPEAVPLLGVAQRQGAANDTAYDTSAVPILEEAIALGVVPAFR